jgi:hypothetical protein
MTVARIPLQIEAVNNVLGRFSAYIELASMAPVMLAECTSVCVCLFLYCPQFRSGNNVHTECVDVFMCICECVYELCRCMHVCSKECIKECSKESVAGSVVKMW